MNGRPEIQYVVVSKPLKSDYQDADIPKRFVRIWQEFVPGKQFTLREFCNEYRSILPENESTAISVAGRALGKAVKMGILIKTEDGHIPEEFLNLQTVSFWLGQLRGNTRTNTKVLPSSTTRSSYARHLWHFNKWLVSKTHEVHVTGYASNAQIAVSVASPAATATTSAPATIPPATTKVHKVKFKSVEDLLELLARPFAVRSDVSIMIKQYLMDPVHKDKRASTIRSTKNSILSYFKRNEQKLEISFDPASIYDNSEIIQTLTLQNVYDMLTIGGPTITEKAVLLCKLHRGLDVSTLIDRFNFQAWEQIVRHFGTDNYHNWDLGMCPVPITLTRLKTSYTHLGFLERDAITTIQKYLGWRVKNTQHAMSADQPLFLTNSLKPIGNGWMTNAFSRLAWRSGVQQKIGRNSWRVDSHEMRSLLKSTLIECGCRIDVADHVIGHKPKDSYEKQAILYGSSIRAEYAKASHMLNIFSNMGSLQTPPCNDEIHISAPSHLDVYEKQVHNTSSNKSSIVAQRYTNDKNQMATLLNVITKLISLNQRYSDSFQSIISALSTDCTGDGSIGNYDCKTHDSSMYPNALPGSNDNRRKCEYCDTSDTNHYYKNVLCCAHCGLLCEPTAAPISEYFCPECGSKKMRVVRVII